MLEHIADDHAAMAAMARTLRPGGRLTALVPAHPRLYGPLDRAFGHYRRYTRERLRDVVEAAGLEVERLYSFNLLGVLGWLAKNRTGGGGIGAPPCGPTRRCWPPGASSRSASPCPSASASSSTPAVRRAASVPDLSDPHAGLQRARDHRDAIEQVLEADLPVDHFELVIVDDHSTDGTRECWPRRCGPTTSA